MPALRAVAPLPHEPNPSLSLRCREGKAQSTVKGIPSDHAEPLFSSLATKPQSYLYTPSPNFGIEPSLVTSGNAVSCKALDATGLEPVTPSV